MAGGTTQSYGLDPERFAPIDDELQRAAAYFARLQAVLGESHSARNAQMVIDEIKRLREALAQSQRHQEIGEAIRRKLYGGGAGS